MHDSGLVTPPEWTRPHLEADGFVGWAPWSTWQSALGAIPASAGGVYVVYRPAVGTPAFLDHSPAGTFRGDPTVSAAALAANWVDAAVVYIGKASHGQLRRRLQTYARFGEGTNARHWGGRLIWQLADASQLLVAWRVMPTDQSPAVEERRLLTAFRRTHEGHPPFANDPHLLGR